ncbi:MAG: type II toxin-antitoxin system mRNA interferase toxin, RelE/StbE family [Draconibacterium sp.]|nr:type II toxin-antitoxin system mRNA interferase toxin, RelE/StbE family [Draconibacterium sp.]
MVRINWTFLAKDDLKNISDYISNDSKKYAKLQVLKIMRRTQILKSHVRIGKVVNELQNQNNREIVSGNYRIIYKIVTETQIDIISIHHSARDFIHRNIK